MSYYEGGNDLLPKGEIIQDVARKERFEEIVKNTIKELYGNARYWEFFKTFSEESVHDFIIEYASKKAYYLINGNQLVSKKEREQFLFRDLAENCLWEIQQKKLFNLQAEWRAGLIDLNGVEVTRDFYCIEKAIRKCTFLSPVTASELNIYIDYLESGEYHEKTWFYHWQDYDSIKNANENKEVVPAWYRYYDSKMGTDYLMLLPDKKGEEEKQFLAAWRKQNGVQHELEMQEDEIYQGTGPDLNMNYETLDFFIKTFENKNLLNYFQSAEKKPKDVSDEALLQDALRLLQKAETNVRLPDAPDWKQSVIKGATLYKTNQIFANLPIVFDEYLFRIKSGIAFPESDDESIYQEYLAFTTLYRQQVKEGKILTEGKS